MTEISVEVTGLYLEHPEMIKQYYVSRRNCLTQTAKIDGVSDLDNSFTDIKEAVSFVSDRFAEKSNDIKYLVICYNGECYNLEDITELFSQFNKQVTQIIILIPFAPQENLHKNTINRQTFRALIRDKCHEIFEAQQVQQQQTKSDISASFLSRILSAEAFFIGGLALITLSVVAAVVLSSPLPLVYAAAGVAVAGVSGFFCVKKCLSQTVEEESPAYQAG